MQAWLAARPRLHFHFTPTGASWLNMAEAGFSLLGSVRRRGSFETVRALVTHVQKFIDRWNVNPTPDARSLRVSGLRAAGLTAIAASETLAFTFLAGKTTATIEVVNQKVESIPRPPGPQ